MVNAPDNLTIAPIFVIEEVSTIMLILFIFSEFSLRQKRHMIEKVLKEKERAKAEICWKRQKGCKKGRKN